MTAMTSRGVHCGNCGQYHPSANDVKVCYMGPSDSDVAHGRYGKPVNREYEDAEAGFHNRDECRQINERWERNNPAESPLARGPQATERQVDFLHKLLNEREYDETPHLHDVRNEREIVSKAHASELINWLKDRPFKSGLRPQPCAPKWSGFEVEPGHYAIPSATGNNDLDFFRVDAGKGRHEGRMFVKRIVGGHPEYGMTVKDARYVLAFLSELTADARSLARQRYGTEIGRCYRCNRHLTDETSRKLGIGPDCRNKA